MSGGGGLGVSHRATPLALGLITSLLTIGGLVLKFGRPVFSWFRQSVWIPFREARTGIPKRTLRIQEGDRRATYWSDGQRGSEPATFVHIALHLTNVTKQNVRASKVELHFRQGGLRSVVRKGDLSIRHPDAPNYNFDYPILANRMARAIGDWIISPPFQKTNRPARVQVCVTDQFGNRSWSGKIRLYRAKDLRRL